MMKESSKILQVCDAITKNGLYVLIFLLPVLFLPWTANTLDFNKQTLLIVAVFIALFAWMVRVLVSGKIKLNFNIMYLPVGILFVAYLLSTIFSLWPYVSFWGWPGVTHESFLTMLGFVLFFILVVNVFEKKEVFYSVFLFALSALLAVLYGILQMFGVFLLPFSFTKVISFNTLGTPNGLALFAGALLPLIIFLIISGKKNWRLLGVISAVFYLVFLLLVSFVFAWWAVIFGALILGAVLVISSKKQKSDSFDGRWIILPMFFLAIALLLTFFQFPISGIPARPTELSLSQSASLDIAKEVIKESPVFGTGPGTFIYNFDKYKSPSFNLGQLWSLRFEEGSSKLFNMLATTGVGGGAAFLLLVVVAIFYGLKNIFKKSEGKDYETMEGALAIGIFSSILVTIFALFVYVPNFTLEFTLFLLLALFASLVSSAKKEFVLKPSSFVTLGVTFVFTLLFIFGLGLLLLEVQRYAAETSYLEGIKFSQQGKIDEAIGKIEGAAKLNSKSDLYWRDLAQVYLQKINIILNQKDLSKSEASAKTQQYVENAVNSAKFATDINSNNSANWSARGQVYLNLIGMVGQGQEIKDWAVRCYEEAAKLEPKNPYFITQEGVAMLRQAVLLSKDQTADRDALLTGASVQFGKALELKSDYWPASFQIAMVYLAQGDQKSVIAKLEETKKMNQGALQDQGLALQLGALYYDEKDYMSAKTELERAVQINPNYYNAWYYLGLAYDQLNQKTAAINIFQKILNANPDNTDLIKILDNLKAGRDALSGMGPQPASIPEVSGEK